MHNINPSLIHGLALQWADKHCPDEVRYPVLRARVDVRVYMTSGAGYYFIHGHGPGKWYLKEDPDANHYTNVQISEVQVAIDAGGRVQIVGDRGKSLGVWPNWDKFAEEVLTNK